MKIKCKNEVTEGMIYSGIKESIKAHLKLLEMRWNKTENGKTYKDNTGDLRHSTCYIILRNGIPMNDKSIRTYRNKSIEETGAKYSAAIIIGGITQTVEL